MNAEKLKFRHKDNDAQCIILLNIYVSTFIFLKRRIYYFKEDASGKYITTISTSLTVY